MGGRRYAPKTFIDRRFAPVWKRATRATSAAVSLPRHALTAALKTLGGPSGLMCWRQGRDDQNERRQHMRLSLLHDARQLNHDCASRSNQPRHGWLVPLRSTMPGHRPGRADEFDRRAPPTTHSKRHNTREAIMARRKHHRAVADRKGQTLC